MIKVSVILSALCLVAIVGVVIAIAYEIHIMVKCMVRMAENQKRAADQRRQDKLDMQLRISHIETRLNRMASRRKGSNRW